MDLFSLVKNQVPILDLISNYTTLKRVGGYWKGICPFHFEKTPSFSVSPHKEIFYCFGCQVTGDVISFLALIERCSQFEATQFLIERFSLQVPEGILKNSSESVGGIDERRRYWKIMKSLAHWFSQQLADSVLARQYLKKRGVSESMIEAFCLGYFPQGTKPFQQLIQHLHQEGFLVQNLIDAGICAADQTLYSPFQGRIIFPICDHVGRVIAFGGRVFVEGDDRPKYYNLRETPYFHKGSTLYNFDRAKRSMQEQGKLFLVEGYLDCIALAQQGFENSVATLGTACTIEHLKQISRYVSEVYLVYDGDQAGRQAIMRIAQLCWQVDLDVRVVQLPTGHDPASFVAAGFSLAPYVEQAVDIFLFFITSLGINIRTEGLQTKLRVAEQMFKMIAVVGGGLKQEILLQAAAKALAISVEDAKKYFLQAKIPHSQAIGAPVIEEVSEGPGMLLPNVSIIEKKLFSVIINKMYVLRDDQKTCLSYFSPSLRSILENLQNQLQKNEALNFGLFYDVLPEEERRIVSSVVLAFQDMIDEVSIPHLIEQLRKIWWRKELQEIKMLIAQAESVGDKKEVVRLLGVFHTLKCGLQGQKTVV